MRSSSGGKKPRKNAKLARLKPELAPSDTAPAPATPKPVAPAPTAAATGPAASASTERPDGEKTKLARLPLLELTRRYAEAKRVENTGKKEAETLRPELLARPEVVVGYQDASIEIKETSEPDYEDAALVEVLKSEGLWEQVAPPKVDPEKVKACATLNARVAEALAANLAAHKARRIHVKPA